MIRVVLALALAMPAGNAMAVDPRNPRVSEQNYQDCRRFPERCAGDDRNRNRRERESAEAVDEGLEQDVSEQLAGQEETPLEIAEAAVQTSAAMEAVEPCAQTETPVAEAVVATPACTEPAPAPIAETAPAPAVPAAEALVTETPVAAPVSEPVGATPELASAAVPTSYDVGTHALTTPAQANSASVEENVSTATPAAVPPAQPVKAAAPVAGAVMQLDQLREILAAAGLTLAVTDPEKLRAAQEAAASIVPAPRVPRERKPLPPVSTEALVQVETRHSA